MANIVYLDIDDEITSAAARIREASEQRLAIVLPVGSRVATSRINFRLLAREALTYGRDLAIVAPEAGTRALAASAGLAVFGSVTEYEAAVEAAEVAAIDEPDGPDAPDDSDDSGGSGVAERSEGPSASGGGSLGAGSVRAGSPGGGRRAAGQRDSPPALDGRPGTDPAGRPSRGPSAGSAMAGVRARTGLTDTIPILDPDIRPDHARRRGPSAWILASLGVLIVVLIVTGASAWLILPTATVTVRSRVEPVGPLQFTVRADPLAVSVDEAAGIVPAQIVTFDLSVTDQFPTTGKKVTETTASGTVRWTNCDPTRSYTIPAGTLARTKGGTGFKTSDAVFLPVAILTGNPPSITCQSREVTAAATETGVDGNVPAGSVTVVPSAFNSVVIRVSNPAATTGGTHVEKNVVAQKDVEAAVTALNKALRDQFTAQVSDPSQAPAGASIYAATKSMSSPQPTLDPATLVGQVGTTFELGMTGTGTATAVNPSGVERLGESRVRAAVASDRSLVAGSVSVTVGAGRIDGSAVVFPVTARAGEVASLDAGAIRAAVKGLSVDEARVRLRDYGDATVDTWPAWVTTITSFDFRLAVTVVSDVPTEPVIGPAAPPTPSPSASPRPTLPIIAPAPSGSPAAGPSAPGPATPSGSASAPPRSTPGPSKAGPAASPTPSGT